MTNVENNKCPCGCGADCEARCWNTSDWAGDKYKRLPLDKEQEMAKLFVESWKERTGDVINQNKITCNGCVLNDGCPYAWDHYNTEGDCLMEK